jgi:hypothetical protein
MVFIVTFMVLCTHRRPQACDPAYALQYVRMPGD